MRPYPLDPEYRLEYAKSHQEMLREEWRTANYWPKGTFRSEARTPGLLKRVRMRAGVTFMDFGRRLMPAERTPGGAALARRPDWGC